jgi:hypothetical protein
MAVWKDTDWVGMAEQRLGVDMNPMLMLTVSKYAKCKIYHFNHSQVYSSMILGKFIVVQSPPLPICQNLSPSLSGTLPVDFVI